MTTSQQQRLTPVSPPAWTPTPPPTFRRSWLTSLSSRIVLAMVLVGFLSALIGGILYQSQVTESVNRLDQRNRERLVETVKERLQASRLPPRVIEQLEEFAQARMPVINTRPLLETALDRSIWVVLVVALGASVLAFGLGWLLTRRIVNPLEQLRRASQQVATGDFSQRVALGGEDEVGQVAYSFNLMAAQLQGAETRRRELLSDVAHELKTPLASIQGHVEALRDNLPRARANPLAIYDIVLEDVRELDRMISSLRTWLNAQSDLENLQIRPLQLKDELPSLLERFRPRAQSANISLELQVDGRAARVLADHNALRHLLSNLLDNALRYTPAGGKVRLLAWPGDGERPGLGSPQRVTFAVADTGIGIAPEHWPHLFERFYRVDKSRTRDTGGTGLGLALVRDLVQAQGGRIWLTSRVGQGTIFFVTLPAA